MDIVDNSIDSWFSLEEQEAICARYHAHIFGHRARLDSSGQPINGIYDVRLPPTDQQRRVYMRGGCVFLLDRIAVESGVRPQPMWAQYPWGVYPDLPQVSK